ncbi:hypothetical protein BG003_001682, partial [Podila horticola]
RYPTLLAVIIEMDQDVTQHLPLYVTGHDESFEQAVPCVTPPLANRMAQMRLRGHWVPSVLTHYTPNLWKLSLGSTLHDKPTSDL